MVFKLPEWCVCCLSLKAVKAKDAKVTSLATTLENMSVSQVWGYLQ